MTRRGGWRRIAALLAVVALAAACRGDARNDAAATPSPNEQGVWQHLTEDGAFRLLGFRPIRPEALPPGFAVNELWGQASIQDGLDADGLTRWGAPYVAIYTIWPTGDQSQPGAIQLQESPVTPLPTAPGGDAPATAVTIGRKHVLKSVNPVGDSGIANVDYYWDAPSAHLHLLALATTGGPLDEPAVESMIAAMPD